ncbi:MAG TPA: hypothetical protein VKG43_06905 [Acidimicrobiales bacterium]|nr:hypothetical protein [Acidimicrobiales bacterium]
MGTTATGFDDLLDHLVGTTELTVGEASRVVGDVVEYFSERAEDYVRRRHGELQAAGSTNAIIFDVVVAELGRRLVRPPDLTARQVRRIVYG